ncbi:MAG: helix-turn-helix transcriptional regulator [Vibrio splendidus]
MALEFIILSELNKKDSTGYDVTKTFREFVGVYWIASHQQVYREMGKLEVRNLVKVRIVPQIGKPDRKLYSITKAGKQHLREWVPKATSMPIFRDTISAKLVASSPEDAPALIDILNLIINSETKQIEEIDTLTAKLSGDNHQSRMQILAATRSRRHHEYTVEWAKEAIAILR